MVKVRIRSRVRIRIWVGLGGIYKRTREPLAESLELLVHLRQLSREAVRTTCSRRHGLSRVTQGQI